MASYFEFLFSILRHLRTITMSHLSTKLQPNGRRPWYIYIFQVKRKENLPFFLSRAPKNRSGSVEVPRAPVDPEVWRSRTSPARVPGAKDCARIVINTLWLANRTGRKERNDEKMEVKWWKKIEMKKTRKKGASGQTCRNWKRNLQARFVKNLWFSICLTIC